MEQKFGVTWYGDNYSVAQTGYVFDRETAALVAKAGGEAADFDEWMQEQDFPMDYMPTETPDFPVVRADVETEEQSNEFVGWSLS